MSKQEPGVVTTKQQLLDDPFMKSVVQDGMRIEWDVPLHMRDGVTLRADVFRPDDDGQYPILMSQGPYGKSLHFKDGYEGSWNTLKRKYPEIFEATSEKYMNWETVDPEKWVPDGYAVVRIDSRGSGRSEGYLDSRSPDEIQDYYDCIEYFAAQPWSNGNVGLAGISYYAIAMWSAAAANPPHLKAICPFEGNFDVYRDNIRHGGIFMDFRSMWYPSQVKSTQHGLGERGRRSSINGVLVSGPETLSEEELEKNRADASMLPTENEWISDVYTRITPDIEKVKVPVLSCANWGGNGLHLRGNIEGYMRCSSDQKWLEIHGNEHYAEFYTNYGLELQKRFFGCFLKNEGTFEQPPVFMNIKHVDGTFTQRTAQEWPPAETQWTKYYFDLNNGGFINHPGTPGKAAFKAESEHLSYFTEPLKEEVELTGHVTAKLYISSTTEDADIYLIFRVLDPDGNDVTTVAASDPEGNLGTGWLRASHRKLDPQMSKPYRPWHTHDEKQPLTPGEIYELDVEVWPICMTVPAGYRFGFTISGRDFSLPSKDEVKNDKYEDWKNVKKAGNARGHSIYTHCLQYEYDEKKIYSGETTIYSEDGNMSYIQLPVMPKQ